MFPAYRKVLNICLPEHWLLEYWKKATDAPERLAETAKAEHIFIITGANYTHDQTSIRIRSTIIDPDGRVIGWQDKVHLFRDESKIALPGESYKLFATPFAKFGITICYDNVFPEAARTIALQGADLLFVPSRVITEGLNPWLLYLKTRALENRIPVIAPNVSDPPRYDGGTVIVDLEESENSPVVLPKIIASSGTGEEVIVANLNLEVTRKLRVNRLSERRPESYQVSSQRFVN
ncbi:MAG: carbon-nitrogen hydrolase family protein [Candidatus Bathyarchaeia archaeon]